MSELRILVVDDNDDKRIRVVAALKEKLRPHDIEIKEASDYEGALAALGKRYFDLLVLDLLLPAAGGVPSELTSRALIQYVTRGTLIPPLYIIGLTAFREIGEKERRFYDEHLFVLEFFDSENLSWADRICAKIEYLMQSKDAAAAFRSHNFGLDVFVLAARYENEFVPIKRHLFQRVETDRHPLWRGKIAFGNIPLANGRSLNAGLACIAEMGMAPAATLAAQAVITFRPRLIGMLGMCCGFAVEECSAPQKLMDAIVVRQVACWEEGKYVDQANNPNEFKNRSKPRFVDDAIREAIETAVEESSDRILPQLRRLVSRREYKSIKEHFGMAVRDIPSVRFGTLVSGSSVIADEEVIREIIQRHPTAIGLDMEMFGLFTAVDRCFGRRPSVLGIKGVADFGHSAKDDFAQRGASIVSAEVFKSILPCLPIFETD